MAKLSEIAAWLGAGPVMIEAEIARVAAPEDAASECIVYATDAATLAAAMGSQAGAVIAPLSLREDVGEALDKPVLWVKHPKLAFARVAQRLTPMRAPAGTHPTAVVVQPELVGEGTSIGPYCVIAPNVRIGARCQILPHVTIYPGVTLGENCVVQSGVVLGATGFGYVHDPESGEYVLFPQQGKLVIEDDVEIGANTTIDRGALGETRIGRGTKIDNLVHIGHNCRIGRNVVIAAQVGISGSCVVEDGAVLAGQVGIGDHCHIGPGVILGGQSGVFSGKSVDGPGEIFAGTPAQPIKNYLKSMAKVRRLK
jgi:UDP-3-O-[3-hydroxymyristoyl] glucosamine N-acyltransferase